MTGPMPYREEGAPAPFTYQDPSAPTLEEATVALEQANHWRARFFTEKRAADRLDAKVRELEAEMAGALETADEAEREAREWIEVAA